MSHVIEVPKKDNNFYMRDDMVGVMKSLMDDNQASGIPTNFMFSGPPGAGKSSAAPQLAAIYNRPFADFACGKMQEPGQWFGEMGFSPEKGTHYITSRFVAAIETPKCVVLLDEVNRVENPKVNNILLPLTDHRGRMWIDEIQREIVVAEGVVFIATINEGLDFAGIDPIDTALRDRFYNFTMNYVSPENMKKVLVAKTGIGSTDVDTLIEVVTAATKTTNMPMRDLLKAARLLKLGQGLRNAVAFGFSRQNEHYEKVLQVAQQLSADTTKTTIVEVLWQ